MARRFRVVGPSGEREIEAADFFQMPDRNIRGENVLAPNELLTHVILPAPGATRRAPPTKCDSSSRTTGRWRSRRVALVDGRQTACNPRAS